jgi:hypothetical protein
MTVKPLCYKYKTCTFGSLQGYCGGKGSDKVSQFGCYRSKMKKKVIKVTDIRKVAEKWEKNNRGLLEESRGSKREFFWGFMVACRSIQDLIDGKIPVKE